MKNVFKRREDKNTKQIEKKFNKKWYKYKDGTIWKYFIFNNLENIAYISYEDAIKQANEIFGKDGWSSKIIELNLDYVN